MKGIFELEGIEWTVLAALLGAWVAIFACLSKGIKSIVKVSVCCAPLYSNMFQSGSHNIIAGVPDRHYAVRSALHTFGASDAAGRHSRRHSVLSRPDFERLLSFRVQYTSICILQVNIVVRYVLYYCYYACKYS